MKRILGFVLLAGVSVSGFSATPAGYVGNLGAMSESASLWSCEKGNQTTWYVYCNGCDAPPSYAGTGSASSAATNPCGTSYQKACKSPSTGYGRAMYGDCDTV
jgi:hypothetical protein